MDGICFHCGTPLRGAVFTREEKGFCCQGCLTVFELLRENGLTDFYKLGKAAGVRAQFTQEKGELAYLDVAGVRERLVDFADDRITRVTFRVPAVHCIACVWLLENLFRLKPGIGHSQVNFPRKEVFISFENEEVKLSEVAALLTSLGYPPDLKLSDVEGGKRSPISRRLWLQLGFAGFAFGNVMLLSISSYLGLDGFSGPGLRKMFGYISFVLALPVLFYSAADYWRGAWVSVKQRILTIEVPIALGLAALAASSTREVFLGQGIGYFDSLAGLLFFLLCGKLFQQKTFDRLAFDRDYKSFFPLAITRKQEETHERVSLSQLQVGNRLVIKNGELIPSDSRIVSGAAVIDYSFVTGESEPVAKQTGDHVYAGGRQLGGAVEIEMVKAVSQSYLTSLWNQSAFHKETGLSLDSLTNRYSQRFTKIVIAIAVGSAGFWAVMDPSRSLLSFVSVLIVACPCALALAAPFTLGSAQRVLNRRKVFLKSAGTVETLARVNSIVFDKTGTLTAASAESVVFRGKSLEREERAWIHSLTLHSTHPSAASICAAMAGAEKPLPVRSFVETPGCGIEGLIAGRELWIGSSAWLVSRRVVVPAATHISGSQVHVSIDGRYRGRFELSNQLRPQTETLIQQLSREYELALLSGDNERERERFQGIFGRSTHLHFNQSPMNKLGFIRDLQTPGKTVMMVGDGLNDAGALKQSDVGVAVVESVGSFSPASDVIMSSSMVPRLHEILRFSRSAVRVVRWSFLISGLYNVVGIALAARGLLSPVICAVLMPLSSLTVVVFACGVTAWFGRRLDRGTEATKEFHL